MLWLGRKVLLLQRRTSPSCGFVGLNVMADPNALASWFGLRELSEAGSAFSGCGADS